MTGLVTKLGLFATDIETITNANGTATKFSNGLMICEHSLNVGTVTSAVGSLFANGTPTVWTFPVPFISPPSLSGSDSGSTNVWIVARGDTAIAYIKPWCYTTIITTRIARMTAIGRWK